MPKDEQTPAQLAKWDQAYTEVTHRLADLIAAYREARAEDKATREIDMVGMIGWIRDHYDHETVCELLAVAIDRALACDSDGRAEDI